MSATLSQLVRDQILAEGPDIASEREWTSQRDYRLRVQQYVDDTLNQMTNVELLERISDQLRKITGALA